MPLIYVLWLVVVACCVAWARVYRHLWGRILAKDPVFFEKCGLRKYSQQVVWAPALDVHVFILRRRYRHLGDPRITKIGDLLFVLEIIVLSWLVVGVLVPPNIRIGPSLSCLAILRA